MFWERGSLLATAITPIIVAHRLRGAEPPGQGDHAGHPAGDPPQRHRRRACAREQPTGVGARGEGPEQVAVGPRGRSVRPADAGRSARAALPVEARGPHRPAGRRDRRRRRHRVRARDLRPLGRRLGPLDQRVRRQPSRPDDEADRRRRRRDRDRGGDRDRRRRRRRDADADRDADAPPPRPRRRPTAAAETPPAAPTATPTDRRRPRRRRPRWPRTRSRPRGSPAPRGCPASPRARRRATSARARRTSRAPRRASSAALERRHIEAAEQIVTALGTMKGAAMKLGQVMSFLDVGLVPEEHREEFQRKLGALRDAAPKVRFAGHAQGDRVRARRASSSETLRRVRRRADRRRLDRPGLPRAAARRARGRGQGPVPRRRRRGPGGHAEPRDDPAADEADRARPRRQEHGRGDPLADRRRARLRARGAEPALAGADLPRPPVHRRPRRGDRASRARRCWSASSSHGAGFDTVKEADQATRDRVGEIVFRFYFGCMYRHRQFSRRPAPRQLPAAAATAAWRSWTSACSRSCRAT